MKFRDALSVASGIIVGLVVFVISLYSLYTDYLLGRSMSYVAVDAFLLFLSSVLIGNSLSIRKRISGYEVAASRAFNEVVYSRLKPILDEVAYGIVEMNVLRKKIEELDRKLDRIEESATTQKLTPEYKLNFYFRAIIVMIFYISTFTFMLQYTLPYNHMLAALLYIYWWAFITHEFKLYTKGEALVMLAAPVLLVPSLYLLIRIFAGTPVALGTVLATSALYAYYYYLIAKRVDRSGEGLRELIGRIRSGSP